MSNQYSVIILIKWIVMRNVLSRNVSFRKVAVAVSGCERQVLVLLTRNFSLLDNRIRKIRIPIHDILMSWKFLVNCPSSWNGLGREPNLKPMFIITRKLYSSQGTHPEPNSSSGYQQHEQHSNYWMKRLMKCSFTGRVAAVVACTRLLSYTTLIQQLWTVKASPKHKKFLSSSSPGQGPG